MGFHIVLLYEMDKFSIHLNILTKNITSHIILIPTSHASLNLVSSLKLE